MATKEAALKVGVGNLADALGAQRLPGGVFAAVPAASRAGNALPRGHGCLGPLGPLGPLCPGVAFKRVLAQRGQLLDELRPAGLSEAGPGAAVVQRARVVEEAEQQRPDERAWTVLVPAEAGHHAVRRALVLDLRHGTSAGLVRRVGRLGEGPRGG